MEERLQELLFELSSGERMAIMLELQEHESKLSHLSQRLSFTTPEASRHLQRLSDAGLIHRNAEGLYGVTWFGRLALSQLSGLDFTVKNREYFQEYDALCLPYEFIGRLGELAGGEIFLESFRALEETARRFKEAEEFVWILSDQNFTLLAPVMIEKLKKGGFDLRTIFPVTAYYRDSVAPISSRAPGMQKRVLPKVEFRVVVTEKVAGVSLPNRNNRLDFRSIIGTDAKFRRWCSDLFLYFWEKAELFVSS
ncbi:MAG: DUF1724 domain-containing protein [Candidatus Bathyarchaeota archaeon]|nr:DUF1724 domain-containing protein [Candidatus Bathyarchaeota archaeon]